MNRREQETVQQIGIAFAENISGELGEDLPDGYWDHAGDVFLDAHADQLDELLADAWFAGFAAQVAPRDNPYVDHSEKTRLGAFGPSPLDDDTTPTPKSAQIETPDPGRSTK